MVACGSLWLVNWLPVVACTDTDTYTDTDTDADTGRDTNTDTDTNTHTDTRYKIQDTRYQILDAIQSPIQIIIHIPHQIAENIAPRLLCWDKLFDISY